MNRNQMSKEQKDNISLETSDLESLIRALYVGTAEFTKENYAKLMSCINNINYEVNKP